MDRVDDKTKMMELREAKDWEESGRLAKTSKLEKRKMQCKKKHPKINSQVH